MYTYVLYYLFHSPTQHTCNDTCDLPAYVHHYCCVLQSVFKEYCQQKQSTCMVPQIKYCPSP